MYSQMPSLLNEAYACWNDADMISSLNMSKVIMEIGSLEWAPLWKSRNVNKPCVLLALYQIQELSRKCTFCYVCHVKKDANMAAHCVSKLSSPSNAAMTVCIRLQNLCTPAFRLMLPMSNNDFCLLKKWIQVYKIGDVGALMYRLSFSREKGREMYPSHVFVVLWCLRDHMHVWFELPYWRAWH
jgi:hypothetical protein